MQDPNLKNQLNQFFGEKEENILRASFALKVMAHPDRLKILCVLRAGEQTVNDLIWYTGLNQSTMSQHLNKLKTCNVLKSRREGNCIYYMLASEQMVEFFEMIKEIYC